MRLGRVPGVAGPTSPNNAGRGAHDEPGPSASVLHMSAFRPSADLRGRAPGRREEPGPGTRARKRTQSWDRPRAAQGRNAVRSHTQVPERAFPLGRDAVLRRPSRGHREHPPPGAPPACRPQAPAGQLDRGPGRRRAGLRAQAQSHRHAGAEATCVCSPGCRPGASRRGSRAGTTAGHAFLEEIDNAQGRDAAPVTRGTPVRARSPAGSRRQSEPEAF